jgi:glycosyltransferase involved in cell wall biosynthesis
MTPDSAHSGLIVGTEPATHETTGTVLVDVVLPCLDEALALPEVLAALPPGCRALVVDNGSSDGSPEIAAALGATVVCEPRRGYGAAVHAGLQAATAELVAVCDADGSIGLADIARLAALVSAGRFDLVVGRRRPVRLGAWPAHARIANTTLCMGLRARTGVELRDLGPLRVARREALLGLGLKDRRSGYPLETVIRANAAGWRIGQVDISYNPRRGRSKVTGTVRGTLQAVTDMSRLLGRAR